MSMESDLRALLVAYAPLTALVSTRIAADRIEQGAIRPFVVFTRTGTEPIQTLDGAVLANKASFDVQCWADTRTSAESVADAIQAALVADARAIVGRASGYDADLDLEATVISVDWWD